MDDAEHYDVLVLGSGEAGKYLAWTLAAQGKRTALVERQYIGGSCPNIACLPSKNFVHTAKVAHYASQAAAFGLPQAHGAVNMEVVRGRKRTMVEGFVEFHQQRFVETSVELILGTGRFVAPKTMRVETNTGSTRTLAGETIILSTGSRATIDSIPGLHEAAPLTHIEMLETNVVPQHLLVLGGGYVGLEFAQCMHRLGSEVTILDRNARLLSREDEDVSEALAAVLLREGVNARLNLHVERVEGISGEAVTVYAKEGSAPVTVSGSHLLAATGRTPNTESLGLELAGVEVDAHGFIRTDEQKRTTADGIFAVGDCAGSPQFTHTAFDDFRIVREALAGRSRSALNRQVPSCLFTDPELAHVGLTENEANAKGMAYRLAKLPMAAVLRTQTLGETDGFLKALVGDNDRILGFTALGVSAGELLAPVQLAMSAGLPYTALRDLIVTHPTITEGLVYLFSTLQGH